MQSVVRNVAELFHRADPSAAFAFELREGGSLVIGREPRVVVSMNSEKALGTILSRGFVGFGEAYMAGDLNVKGDLQELLRLGIAAHIDTIEVPLHEKVKLLFAYLNSRNTAKQAARNIACHYDRGDELYKLYLDSAMAYSCAYFKNDGDSLEQAQMNKYDHISRKLMLGPNDHLLDLGCGWGGMLIYAAQQYATKGLGNTISQNQYQYADKKIKSLGLQGRISVRFQDYRDLSGEFDKIVSIGMFEHVGKKFIPTFMQKVSRLLKKGGLGLLHTIGKDVATPLDPWINKYIFPGGYLPSLSEIIHHLSRVGLVVLDVENLRLHYARTLDLWAENFDRNEEEARALFGESFVRMWRLFLHASAAAFRYGDNRLYQILFSNGLSNNAPITREHIYRP
ncbi:MAG TPA: cyclopropane-fatty-acyl-phospholipid synthase family protein [Thermodesulfobacteriota bacterium]|nr:class I SAM-dependent methyltransferase [Deltaproteobacteria bacterium]HNR12381.1 cyclopropane-fatty-acyl-phospholipid synthase family protein [Thermodesulfobacteriota bacterium]HNU71817.1 cyclopropane-fatty-acyl-phospholipid synthase family protein [Thermodesulfobacteriota bacterium]HOC39424.1 cyclopropane-fatty-acyl-phospholipid synthase family protein [Thermodesulfobacteriota bacterium]HQO77747.1 cyclopropane-fatty-acyl-phospholipid synthase family protein [Thermodesulfobacteriota bacteri